MRGDTGQRLLMAGPERLLAVLGRPIAHSRSPQIHRAAYDALGLPWRYSSVRIGEAGLESFLAGRDERWLGFSVTMPLKEEAHRLSSVLDPVAAESGVVNTLLRLPAETGSVSDVGPRWAGFNTDVAGLARAIAASGLDASDTVVIGSGATSVSATLAVRRLGARRVSVLARNAEASAELVSRFSGTREPGSDTVLQVDDLSERSEAPAEATLVVSTLPGPAGGVLDLPDGLTGVPLFDVAYDPWPSPLATRWREAGGIARAGLTMLVEQALVQVRIFAGGDPDAPLPAEAGVLAEMTAAGVAV